MAVEIERKFLVRDLDQALEAAERSYEIAQGYISSTSGRTVRIRLRDGEAFLTIKGPSLDGGISRFEWETPVSEQDARSLMTLCELPPVFKTRHIVPHEGHIFEVDVFHGANEGLVVAEVELSDADEPFARPSWLGDEVTGDRRYYNSQLARHPFLSWD